MNPEMNEAQKFVSKMLGEAALSLESIMDQKEWLVNEDDLTEVAAWLRLCQDTIRRGDGMWPELKAGPPNKQQESEARETLDVDKEQALELATDRISLAMDVLRLPNVPQMLAQAAEAVLLEYLGYDPLLGQLMLDLRGEPHPDACPTCGSPRCAGAPRFKGICPVADKERQRKAERDTVNSRSTNG